jgi:Fungal specific transcription factor domain
MPGVAEGACHPLSTAWFEAMCRSRALFHTVVVLGARHLDFLRKSTSFSDSQLALAHKGRAIRELGDALADSSKASSDENILAMLWMASAEIVPEDRNQVSTSAFNPPLPNDQWIDAWASASGTEHSNMMRELIEMRGGLDKIGLFGLAKVLSL